MAKCNQLTPLPFKGLKHVEDRSSLLNDLGAFSTTAFHLIRRIEILTSSLAYHVAHTKGKQQTDL